MKLIWSLLPLLAAVSAQSTSHKFDHDAHDYYAVHLSPSIHPETVANQLGLLYHGPFEELKDHHIFKALDKHEHDLIKTQKSDLKRRRRKREAGAELPHVLDNVLLSNKQNLSKRFPLEKRIIPAERQYTSCKEALKEKRQNNQFGQQAADPDEVQRGFDIAENLHISDPIFQEQWHLHNTIEVGHDINVTGVWAQGITGKNKTVCIVDDGLDMDSDDLKDNYFAEGSWDFNDQGPDPKPRLSDDKHGTRCAGEISAVRNDICGVGVAYDGKVSGCRILSKVISDAEEAKAMNYKMQDNHIYSCSWGPPDNGKAMEEPGILIRRAMLNGIQNGRSGLGSIFVFAIGNGAANDDNCNFDGYTNSIYSVSVGGIDRKGLHPYYSEKCSAQLVVTYSSGSGDAIHTTDVGKDLCYVNHGGTSAAGPLVAGIYSLMLEVNDKLTWRDIQWITVITAVEIDQPAEYQMNQAMKKNFSHQFGYGKADAYAMVEAAKTWKSVKPQAWFFSPWLHVKHPVPQGEHGLASSFEVTADMLKKANLERVEHVTVTMNVEHTRRGDLSVELRSPTGMVSHIATSRRSDDANSGYVDWTFMSVAHWGESGVGKWTVIVKDTKVNEHSGTFTDWHLKLFGEAIDGEKQELLPLPDEDDDNDHDVYETQTATAHTTTIAVPTETGEPVGNPTDHPERPTKPKPNSTTATPTPTPDVTDDKEEVAKPTSTSDSNLLPHIFPTFGVSKRTQVWIYGATTLILVFLVALCGWAIYYRRKKRVARDDFAFEMVNQEDANEDSAGLLNGHSGGRKKRAGELYDATAGYSDEAGASELGSDGGARDQRYRDDEPTREGTDVR
ncbi:Kexin [Fulvia fulva]|uniref:Kexin n=1 Tax=Passalora fulva TaxID=5499 RepID=A0A9Q8LDT1_PASFU|nr:Kexin [Fulvia fulva]KAK4629448.1 Kexin [Fulvia fulva]KAK4629856.1 Kexin [Fulvia fulva]UJO15384.1 Kexin [Fulvia fulva]WPV12269.1 Kexin [Fulvia fulva]WPV27746.1 Kexin [Fulvia fulva]